MYKFIFEQTLSLKYITAIDTIKGQSFTSTEIFHAILKNLSVSQKYAVKTLGRLIDRRMPENMVISDDAGQFDVLIHALCWIHIERNLQKIHAYTNQQGQELELLLKAF